MVEYLVSKEQTYAISWTKRIQLLLYLSLVWICSSSCADQAKQSRVEVLPYYNEATFTPNWLQEAADIALIHQIPEFSLINQNKEVVTEKTFEGKIYVTDFFFTSCPGICPKMTANMQLIQEAFKEDNQVLLLSHSVTPTHDTPEILKKYAIQNDIIDDKWHLVTGERDEIYDLGRNQYFVEENLGLQKTKDEFLHTENFILIDTNRYIRGIYNGLNKVSVQQLIADIHTLKKQPF